MDYLIQSPRQLSSHLRAWRKARSLSQAQLGQILGVGPTRVTRIEQDPAAISVQQFLSILSALGVQMVLRPKESEPEASKGGRPARATRRPSEEPW